MFDDFEVIDVYTRAQAIADGVLVDLRQGDADALCRDAGFRWPIACTHTVYASVIALTEAAKAAGCDVKGRLWDVLMMLRWAVRGAKKRTDLLFFKLDAVIDGPAPETVTLKALCHPGDGGEPVITIMYPEED